MNDIFAAETPIASFPAARWERWKTILTIAWPLIVANSFWNLQMTIDRLFLADYSTGAMGAAVAVMGVFWTPMALLQQTAAYVTTFIAQYFGAGRKDMIGRAFWQSVYVSIGGGLLFFLLIPMAGPMFAFMGHNEEMQRMETEYFIAMCWSAIPTAIVAATSGYFTGLGRTRVILQINGVGLVANTLLVSVLIHGNYGFPALGIRGAGYAAAGSALVAAIYGMWLVLREKNHAEYGLWDGWRWDGGMMLRFIRFGIPAGLQWALEGVAFSVFLIFIGRLPAGDAALSASSIVVTLMMLAILPVLGMAQASAVLVGQFLGEKKPAEAEAAVWSGWQVSIAYILLAGASFIAFPGFYLGWFANSADAELWAAVSTIAPVLLLFVAFFIVADSTNLVFAFSLKGAGDTRFVTIIPLLLPWPLMIAPTILLRHMEGAVFLSWAAALVYSVVQALIFWRRFVGGRWKSMSVIN